MDPGDPWAPGAPRAPLSESAAALRVGMAAGDWTTHQWWQSYAHHGGRLTEAQVHRVLAGRLEAGPADHDRLAHVLNQHLHAIGTHSLVRLAAELDRTAHHPSRWRED